MTGVLDVALGSVARTLTKTFGRSATLKHGGSAAFSTTTGDVTMSSADYACEVVFSEYHERQFDGTLVKRGDRKAIVSRLRLGVEPVPDRDTLVEGGRTWRIVNVKGYSSGAQEAAYELQVRR